MSAPELLQINGTTNFDVEGRYLEVRSATGEIEISGNGLAVMRLSSGEQVDLHDIEKIKVRNVSGSANIVDLQTFSHLKVGNSVTDVAITNIPSIQRIEEAIQVTAQATVENGTMHVILGTTIADSPDISINAKSKKLLLAANSDRKAVLIQVISSKKTQLRIGGVSVTAGRGAVVAGSINAIGSMPIETSGAIYAFNESSEQAKVAIVEILK